MKEETAIAELPFLGRAKELRRQLQNPGSSWLCRALAPTVHLEKRGGILPALNCHKKRKKFKKRLTQQ